MSDTIACPRCSRLLHLSDAHTGREVCCPNCRCIFTASAAVEMTASPPRVAPQGATSEPPPVAAWPRQATVVAEPSDQEAVADDDDENLSEHVPVFEPGRGWGKAAKRMLSIVIFVELVGLASSGLQYDMVNRIYAGRRIDRDDIARNNRRQIVVRIVELIAFVPAGIVFLIWFARAHANLRKLGARDLVYSPVWAVVYWFVPILNLFRPMHVAQEIWRHSDPDEPVGRDSILIGPWWIIWIIANISSSLAMLISANARSIEGVYGATMALIVADGVSILAGLLAIRLVSAIDARQAARALRALRAPREFAV